jgi:hypothetical protein
MTLSSRRSERTAAAPRRYLARHREPERDGADLGRSLEDPEAAADLLALREISPPLAGRQGTARDFGGADSVRVLTHSLSLLSQEPLKDL